MYHPSYVHKQFHYMAHSFFLPLCALLSLLWSNLVMPHHHPNKMIVICICMHDKWGFYFQVLWYIIIIILPNSINNNVSLSYHCIFVTYFVMYIFSIEGTFVTFFPIIQTQDFSDIFNNFFSCCCCTSLDTYEYRYIKNDS